MRRLLGAAGLLGLASCGGPALAGSMVPAPAAEEIAWSFFLIGDTGDPEAAADPTFAALESAARHAPDRTTIIFLGDNVYPAGLPASGDEGRANAERVLDVHLGAVRRSGAQAFFVLGNHDWAGGVGAARRQAAWIAERSGGAVVVLPAAGCPGPASRDVGGVRLVFLDTDWWLREDGGGPECVPTDSAGVVDSLAAAIAGAGSSPVLVLAHHPLASGGRHGGHFGWRHHLFPLTDLARWAWLPLPVIGSLYPLARTSGMSQQDFSGGRNRAMRGALAEAFARRAPAAYVAGHEHAIQVIRGAASPWFLVSGGGSTGNGTFVARTDSTRYASLANGWIRVDRLVDGRLRVSVVEATPAAAAETWSDWMGR
ncbi:MAG TPA: metallophosphoesterase [Gemmatimonadales bacterium]|nr:metallophosphoesterase [Gemmatimonadales bacterium]